MRKCDFVTPAGSPSWNDFTAHFDENGVPSIEVSGKVYFEDQMSAIAPSLSVKNLVARYCAGDYTALGDPRSGRYDDVSESPVDLLEMHEKLTAEIAIAQTAYEKLPKKVRKDMSFGDFMQLVSTGKISIAEGQPKVSKDATAQTSTTGTEEKKAGDQA